MFDYVLNIRYLNDGIDTRRTELFDEYLDRKYASHRFTGMAQYDDWKESYDAKSKSQSQFVRDRLMRNVDMFSNGESAMKHFVDRITENALYLLDEPENSLSIGLQQDLCDYISASASHYRIYNEPLPITSVFTFTSPTAKIMVESLEGGNHGKQRTDRRI